VLNLGDEIEVTVEEIDDRGKVSLVPAGDLTGGSGAESGTGAANAAPSAASGNGGGQSGSDVETVSFEASFDAELANEFGDLGPASERPVDDDRGRSNDRGRNDRGGRERGGRRHR
jgi:polyribonucleotide nucleotidyltransferase